MHLAVWLQCNWSTFSGLLWLQWHIYTLASFKWQCVYARSQVLLELKQSWSHSCLPVCQIMMLTRFLKIEMACNVWWFCFPMLQIPFAIWTENCPHKASWLVRKCWDWTTVEWQVGAACVMLCCVCVMLCLLGSDFQALVCDFGNLSVKLIVLLGFS